MPRSAAAGTPSPSFQILAAAVTDPWIHHRDQHRLCIRKDFLIFWHGFQSHFKWQQQSHWEQDVPFHWQASHRFCQEQIGAGPACSKIPSSTFKPFAWSVLKGGSGYLLFTEQQKERKWNQNPYPCSHFDLLLEKHTIKATCHPLNGYKP